MKTITGRITRLQSSMSSGLASLVLTDGAGEQHRLYIEAGFGVRQLLRALEEMGAANLDDIAITLHVDGAMVTSVETEDE